MSSKKIQSHTDRLRDVTGFLKMYRINNSGLSQLDLSLYSGVHRNTIVRYESCNPENLTLQTIFNIADALELDVNQIFLEIK